MSADNGIYILKSVGTPGTSQYRVRELHNVEALFAQGKQRDLNWAAVQAAFADCTCFTDIGPAFSFANELLTESERTGFRVENGVLMIETGQAMAA